MIHDIEIILHLVHSPVESVDAVGVPVLSASEDIANVRIRFRNGCVANITTSRISPEKLRKIRVFQDDAYLSLDYQNQSGEIYRKEDGKITRDKIPVEKDEPLKLEINSFLDCVRHRGAPVVGGAQAAAALELAMKITAQIKNSRPSSIPTPRMSAPESETSGPLHPPRRRGAERRQPRRRARPRPAPPPARPPVHRPRRRPDEGGRPGAALRPELPRRRRPRARC